MRYSTVIDARMRSQICGHKALFTLWTLRAPCFDILRSCRATASLRILCAGPGNTHLLEIRFYQHPTLPIFKTIFPTKRSLKIQNLFAACFFTLFVWNTVYCFHVKTWSVPPPPSASRNLSCFQVIHWNYRIAASFLCVTFVGLFFF